MATAQSPLPTETACGGTLRALEPVKRAAWLGFLQAHSVVLKALDAELDANFGLQMSGVEVLSRIAAAPEGHLRMSEVAEQALLSQSRVSRLVDELELRGLLERKSCPGDTRVVHATITQSGRELVERVQELHFESIERRFFDGLNAEEIHRLAELWPRVIAAASSNDL